MIKKTLLGTVMLLGVLGPVAAMAESLTAGMKAEISAADPHVLFGPNRDIGGQVHEPLFGTDTAQNPVPGLVTDWQAVAPTVCEFHLRDDVSFSDGQRLTSVDVKFLIERAQTLDAPRTFKTYLSNIESVEIIDDTTFRIHTTTPSAILVHNLATVGTVSSKAAADAGEGDFLSGKAAIGPGPYLWSEWVPGDHVRLSANTHYWGSAPTFDKITYKFI